MTTAKDFNLKRIGVFYDGNYFLHVSNFYNYFHERKSRISISGLHHFIRHQIAQLDGTDVPFCQIVDAHYFRGRLSAAEASQQGNALYYDRLFDDILGSEGVATHYLPVKSTQNGRYHEKGIDVWLALEAFELAMYKKFDVLVLIASDGDYVPLIRKLNTLGTRVMVLSWDFVYTNDFGREVTTRTSQDLLEEVTYPIAMHELIDNRLRRNEPIINNLFVPQNRRRVFAEDARQRDHGAENTSTILTLKNGFGFIKWPPNNLFFHHENLVDVDFNDLNVDDRVTFTISPGERKEDVATNVRLAEADE